MIGLGHRVADLVVGGFLGLAGPEILGAAGAHDAELDELAAARKPDRVLGVIEREVGICVQCSGVDRVRLGAIAPLGSALDLVFQPFDEARRELHV